MQRLWEEVGQSSHSWGGFGPFFCGFTILCSICHILGCKTACIICLDWSRHSGKLVLLCCSKFSIALLTCTHTHTRVHIFNMYYMHSFIWSVYNLSCISICSGSSFSCYRTMISMLSFMHLVM